MATRGIWKLSAGDIVGGRFRIGRSLDNGGMGAVYSATDLSTGDEVALKVVRPELATDPRHRERFRREAEITRMLSHPHLVRAIATGVEEEGTPWLAMELIEGQSLHVYMRSRGTLPVAEAVGIIRQLVAGLGAAHRVGVIHRDIKPSNIMLSPRSDVPLVRVVDLGVARFQGSSAYRKLTMTGQIVGTPGYLSPEQAAGLPPDARSDLFAVGAVLHALLTGRSPFGKGTEALVRLNRGERVPLSESHPQLGPITNVVDRCLEMHPDRRFQSARELDDALAPFDAEMSSVSQWDPPDTIDSLVLPPDPVLDIPTTRPAIRNPQQRPGVQRGKWLAGGVALIVALVLGGAVLNGVASPEDSTPTSSPSASVANSTASSTSTPTSRLPSTEAESLVPAPAWNPKFEAAPCRPARYQTTVVVREGTLDASLLEQSLRKHFEEAAAAETASSPTDGRSFRMHFEWERHSASKRHESRAVDGPIPPSSAAVWTASSPHSKAR